MAISMLKIRRPLGRLIFNMGIAIPGKTVFLIETAPWEATPNETNWDQVNPFETRQYQVVQNDIDLALGGRGFWMATQNETIWDQQWDHFSLDTQNESFLVWMSPQVAHWVLFRSHSIAN